MKMNCREPIGLYVCAMKHFRENESHVTRLYSYHVLILMLGGTLRFFEDGKLIELHKGEYYIQRAGLLQEGLNVHQMPESDDPAVYFFIEFRGGNFSDERPGVPIRGRFESGEMEGLIRACDAAASDRRGADLFLLNAYMHRIFSMLHNEVEDDQRLSDLLRMVRRYIDSEYASIRDVGEVAHKFGYQTDYLSRIFHRAYGTTVFRYLKQVRMKQAMWLLQNSPLLPAQVAETVGYADYSAFYRAFLSHFSITPAEIAKQKTSF